MKDIKNKAKIMAIVLHNKGCTDCAHNRRECKHLLNDMYCNAGLHTAADIIEQLVGELERVERERDAAIADFNSMMLNEKPMCEYCAEYTPCERSSQMCYARRMNSREECRKRRRWRGVQEE